MNNNKLAIIFTLCMLAGAPVSAADQDEAQLEKAVEAHNAGVTDESQQLVCRKEAVTGSRIKKTVCRTVATMEAEQEAAKRYVNKPRPVPYKD